MPIESALTHPVFVKARQAALARPELRFARAPSAAPVRVTGVTTPLSRPYAGAIPAEPPRTPTELPPPPSPPTPEPAAPEITDIPPDTMPVPVREPPVMPQPIAA